MSRTWHEKRKSKYTGSRRFDRSCRNHGACGWCYSNRTHSNRRREPINEYGRLERGSSVVERKSHDLDAEGSTPSPATTQE